MSKVSNATNFFSPAKWVVNPTPGVGTHTTWAGALAAASAGDSIAIMPGTYNENPSLVAGVNVFAFDCDRENNVILNGQASYSGSGIVSISGIKFTTNSNYFLSVTGSNASQVYLEDCYFNCTNHTGIQFSSSNSSAVLQADNCSGNLGTTGIGLIAHSSAGTWNVNYNIMTNTGGSTTGDTISAGIANYFYALLLYPVTTSSTAQSSFNYVRSNTATQNVTSFVLNGASNQVNMSQVTSGSASCISIGSAASCDIHQSPLNTTNTYAVTGTGVVNPTPIPMVNTGIAINPTLTQNPTPFTFGKTNSSGTITSDSLYYYEEGTFTPTVQGASTAGTTTYVTQNGFYTRIGRMVMFQIDVQWSAATGTGVVEVGGLPFTANSGMAQYPLKMYSNDFSIGSATEFMPLVAGGTSTIAVYGVAVSTGSLELSSLASNQAGLMYINGAYFV